MATNLKLYGTITSPFVRRIRLLLANKPHEFIPTSVYTAEDQQFLAQHTPTGRIPLLIDGDTIIWDSALITQYLTGRQENIETQKLLVLINEANDAGVTLFQFEKFGMGVESIYAQKNRQRLEACLAYLHTALVQNQWNPAEWQPLQMWLYVLLDWLAFRKVSDWQTNQPQFIGFMQQHAQRAEVVATDPRG